MMELKHKKTGEIVTVVPHLEPLRKGYALGLGEGIYSSKGISVRRPNGHYAFVKEENVDKFFEEVSV
jgi:hypothetical protein